MGILQRAKIAYSVMTQKELRNSLGTVVRNFTGDDHFVPQRSVKGITYKAVDKIGTSAAEYELQVLNSAGEPIKNHPLINLVDHPNPKQNKSDFIHTWAMQRIIFGEAFIYKAKGEVSKKTKEIYLLNPTAVELVVESGELVGYILHKSNGDRLPLDVSEVYHDKKPNPFNEWRGMSIVEQAAVYSNTELTTAEFTLNYIRNNASPSGIVSLPNMTSDTFKQFAAQWRENYEGPKNAGKTAFIRGEGVDFKAVGATLQDIDQKVTREMAKEDVLMMLEVPSAILGKAEQNGLGRANIETIYYIFNKEVINKLHEKLDDIFFDIAKTGGLLNGVGQTVSHITIVPEDKDYKLARQEKSVNRWMTVNEVRAMDNLPPLPGGDEIVAANAAPVTQTKTAKHVMIKKQPSKYELKKAEQDKAEEMRVKVVEISDAYSKEIKTEIAKFAGKQEAKVIGNINASAKSFEEWLYSVKDESEALKEALIPILVDLMEAQTENVKNFISGELITITPEIKTQVESRILQIAGVYNQETLRALEATLAEGQASGESLVKLKKRVEDVYGQAKGYRAERIARTESLKASNLSAELTYKQSGFSTVKWFTNPGACPFCQSFDGRIKTIGGKPFAALGDVVEAEDGSQLRLDYDNVEVPPLHANCRCSLVPE